MDKHTYHYLANNPSLIRFVRYNPVWYRYLSRDPRKISEIEKEAKKFYGKTFPQRMDRLNNQVQMMGMLMQFAEEMKD
ncbi:YlbE-like family protein [Virgibacillus sp. YIM 98842]|uniref:YlbE-like family protein n=1 Tax=Virgibacillus sp. YIM 98842 TaxID=2663533 RepID=UPI001F08F919|nr:YlbE-like family protein [Virgibacillus sp. YIM 98842]